jgi:hypothetical protein
MPIRQVARSIKKTISRSAQTAIAALLISAPAAAAKLQKNFSAPVIASVSCHLQGNILSYPIAHLNSSAPIILSFDYIGDNSPQLSYSVTHCTSNWEKSNMMVSEYHSGFAENYIDPRNSFSTEKKYAHYSITISPGNYLISGNYIVEVFNTATQEVLLSQRIGIVGYAAPIEAKVQRATIVEYRNEYQEVDVWINVSALHMFDPFSDIKLVILQNGDWNIARCGMKPKFANNGILDYDYEEGNLFPGGNEFRTASIREFATSYPDIKSVKNTPHGPYIELEPQPDRQFLRYTTRNDINGRFSVNSARLKAPETESEYAQVLFTLHHDTYVLEGEPCIYGQLTNWTCDSQEPMVYDFSANAYTKELMLKQGNYDYKFALNKLGTGLDFTYFEGSHYETENDYLVLAYFRDFMTGYDRLVGYAVLNSKLRTHVKQAMPENPGTR